MTARKTHTLIKGRGIRSVDPRVLQYDRGRSVFDNRRELTAGEEGLGERKREHVLEAVVDIDPTVCPYQQGCICIEGDVQKIARPFQYVGMEGLAVVRPALCPPPKRL